ncbi:MAG TPA: FAD-dependent monooxygenase [Nitrospira sp.]|nr:FAD-dependent monooxygenase [Nitrospira sp.]
MSSTVAIVGGGIGGLAAAGFLHKAGLNVTVYEQAVELKEVGAGVVVSPNAMRLLRRLGELDRFLGAAVPIETGWEFRRWQDGSVLSSEEMSRSEELYGESSYFIHRADLLETVRGAVPVGLVHLGARCTGIDLRPDGAILHFAGGSNSLADVVIGADGVHSTIRGAVVTPGPAAYSGMCAFRALVPAEQAPIFARRPVHTLWLGPDHHLVHYPVSAGRKINIVAFAPAREFRDESWSTFATVDELAAEFRGWDPRLLELIAHAGRPGRWALVDRAPLTRWSKGRVTLLGDAAHAMFPFYAQGAAQAIEDAAALALCLSVHRDDPELALDVYQRVRIPRAGRIQQLSHSRKDINHLPDGPEQQRRDAELCKGDALVRSGWIYAYDAEDAARQALSKS